mmetsp:Transcript_25071/g.82168  ORF Transcript_25071/g.82168 Transcript_25071/m.82168 type:complete len:269 (+) Transcript_25071:1425-2231(+)
MMCSPSFTLSHKHASAISPSSSSLNPCQNELTVRHACNSSIACALDKSFLSRGRPGRKADSSSLFFSVSPSSTTSLTISARLPLRARLRRRAAAPLLSLLLLLSSPPVLYVSATAAIASDFGCRRERKMPSCSQNAASASPLIACFSDPSGFSIEALRTSIDTRTCSLAGSPFSGTSLRTEIEPKCTQRRYASEGCSRLSSSRPSTDKIASTESSHAYTSYVRIPRRYALVQNTHCSPKNSPVRAVCRIGLSGPSLRASSSPSSTKMM